MSELSELEEFARTLVDGGFADREEVVEAAVECFEDEATEAEVVEVVDRLWQARLAEQATWPEHTDADRVLAVFAALDAAGIVARADFTCCGGCGAAEIHGQARDGDRGYVFFHRQDLEGAAWGGGLHLSYGSFDGDATRTGREVVAALEAAGLGTEWNGSAATRILVTPLNWQMRVRG